MPSQEEIRIENLERKIEDIEYQLGKRFGGTSNGINTNDGIFRNLQVKGYVKTVALGDDIQKAIDVIDDIGGGTVQLSEGTYTLTDDITIPSSCNLVGAGRDSTILEFSGSANGIVAKGTNGSEKQNMLLAGFTLQNSNNTAGIDIDYFDFWRMENVRVTSCDQKGVRIQNSSHFTIQNCRSDNNTGNNFEIGLSDYYTIDNNLFDNGTTHGLVIDQASGVSEKFKLTNNTALDNGGDGFNVGATGTGTVRKGSIIGNLSEGNASDGFYFATTNCTIIGNISDDNTAYSFVVKSPQNTYLGNIDSALSTATGGWDINADQEEIVFVGNISGQFSDKSPADWFSNPGNNNETVVAGHLGGSLRTKREMLWMKNTSGGSLSANNVVVMKGAASGEEFDTTTTQGDDLVLGVVNSASIANDAYGFVQTLGYTNGLKVDGNVANISIGDFLGTDTDAGLARQAAAGDMAFAIALEASTTDNDTINALLISPRKV